MNPKTRVIHIVHEWALAEAVIEYLVEKGKKRLRRLVLGFGELQSIDKEVFMFALENLLKENNIVVDSIETRTIKARFKCRRCGYEWGLKDIDMDDTIKEAIHFLPETVHAFVSCPSCNSIDYDIVRGRGLTIEEIEER